MNACALVPAACDVEAIAGRFVVNVALDGGSEEVEDELGCRMCCMMRAGEPGRCLDCRARGRAEERCADDRELEVHMRVNRARARLLETSPLTAALRKKII